MDEPADATVTREERRRFDRLLEDVLGELPGWVHERLEEMPLIVEDYPADTVLDELDIDDDSYLCGLHTGVPLTERSVHLSGVPADRIQLYRNGILNAAANRFGRVDPDRLRQQIRITLLHEIGHHFGLDEDELAELGYG